MKATTRRVGSDTSDLDLVAQFLDGEDMAFAELVQRHGERLFQFVSFALGGRTSEAEDVSQEVLIQAFKSLPRFRGDSSFRTWLYGIAKNICRGRMNTTRWRGSSNDAVLLTIPDGAPDPLQRLERDDACTAVQGAIAQLSPLHRSIIFLREFEGLSYSEIAATMNLPVGTVRSRLHNARAVLATQLQSHHRRSVSPCCVETPSHS